MLKDRNRQKRITPRIEMTAELRDRLGAFKDQVPEIAKRAGLPYFTVYNLVHGRVRSISVFNYRKLFREEPPAQQPRKVDGTFFRQMSRLWLSLNDDATQAGLYREYFGRHHTRRIDYRIFTGQVRTVPAALEKWMLAKFAASGLARHEVERWIEEFEAQEKPGRVAYERVRPILRFLHDHLGVHPTAILNQALARYEAGKLTSVSREIYLRARALQAKTRQAIASGRDDEIERLREGVYGGKRGYTLFSQVEEELRFLNRFARKGVKAYLGRGLKHYEQGRSRRIASWRAEKIVSDCEAFIRRTPGMPLASLPRAQRQKQVRGLLSVLTAGTAHRLMSREGRSLEKRILKPRHEQAVYNTTSYGFIDFDKAPRSLGMKKKAFDLMVAGNCEIFRYIGKYRNRWYLPNLYLQELSEKKNFNLISIKYEMMARQLNRSDPADVCFN
jgi:hypothetical protein